MAHIVSGVASQYGDSSKLAARARLNSVYTLSETGWFPWVARHLCLSPGQKVLDIGCGPGWFWEGAGCPPGLELTLADTSPGMVAEAVARCQGLPFASVTGRTADAMALPFDAGSFDTVIAMHMLYHVPDPAQAIAELFRVLRPGGMLAVTTNGAENMAELYALTTVLGSAASEPAAAVFGFDHAERIMRAQFGQVEMLIHPARMRITEAEDVFLALTSYPPGDGASEDRLTAFRAAIAEAFARNGGALDVRKATGLFLSRKPG